MFEENIVSVVIPTYKRADTLPRAIDSVLNQSYKNIEIIVVDDNNPDTEYRKYTESIMDMYKKYKNVIYLKHDKNKNGSAARNTGIRHANGEYIMFLDDDDEFFPEKVSAQVKRLNSLDNSWGACYTNYIRKKNGETIVWGAEKREGSLLSEELMRNLFVHAGSNLLIRKSVVDEINGFDENFERNQDIEFLSRILMRYKLAYADVIGLIVHVHNNKPNKKSFEEITFDYIQKFTPIINRLPESDKIKINKMINLQLFRHYITTFGKRKKAIIQIIKRELTVGLIIRYIFHLVNRKLTKKAFGFKIK
ncbi:glycosyltransferase family 2 protein [Neobacillus sp. CF12]|uniref:glycosyltransferase family 2 protein n=1 Tax=Neobacillus sp. CF12 TaxID=3055864 RepID=UPI0025A1A804|nr:glycosyltransferase family 2 protein [Neobacillus sp. CF12]MDM5329839.1 glycosyltransferase family 2 protein [Neobacillus sp. CF12]